MEGTYFPVSCTACDHHPEVLVLVSAPGTREAVFVLNRATYVVADRDVTRDVSLSVPARTLFSGL